MSWPYKPTVVALHALWFVHHVRSTQMTIVLNLVWNDGAIYVCRYLISYSLWWTSFKHCSEISIRFCYWYIASSNRVCSRLSMCLICPFYIPLRSLSSQLSHSNALCGHTKLFSWLFCTVCAIPDVHFVSLKFDKTHFNGSFNGTRIMA